MEWKGYGGSTSDAATAALGATAALEKKVGIKTAGPTKCDAHGGQKIFEYGVLKPYIGPDGESVPSLVVFMVESVAGFLSNGGAINRKAAAEELGVNPQRCRACLTRWLSYYTALKYIASKWAKITKLV